MTLYDCPVEGCEKAGFADHNSLANHIMHSGGGEHPDEWDDALALAREADGYDAGEVGVEEPDDGDDGDDGEPECPHCGRSEYRPAPDYVAFDYLCNPCTADAPANKGVAFDA